MADPEVSVGFKPCYRHPRKPAIRNCISCNRPICKLCGDESGDALICPGCREAQKPRDTAPTSGPVHGAPSPPERATPATVGEVTILEDGTVVAPPQGEPVEPEVTPEAPVGAAPAVGSATVAVESMGPPAVGSQAVEPAKPVTAVAVPETGVATPKRALRRPSKKPSRPAAKDRTSTRRQVMAAIPYTLAAAILVTGLWLLIPAIAPRWTQMSVLTLGLVVPWVLHNSSTRKKRMGRRVWTSPPPTLVTSLVSLAIVTVFSVIMEVSAYLLIARQHIAFSAFARAYLGVVGWVLIFLGLLVAVLVPYAFQRGAAWSMPTVRRRGEASKTTPSPSLQEESPPPEAPTRTPLDLAELTAQPEGDAEREEEVPAPVSDLKETSGPSGDGPGEIPKAR